MLTDDDILDKILDAFVGHHDQYGPDTLEGFLDAIGSDEAVLALHMAIHKYFGD